jgi:nitrite reductase/ring-hydroxylating ferredoxin subunit
VQEILSCRAQSRDAMSALICSADDVPEGEAKSFIIGEGKERRDIVVVRRHGKFHAYENSCPHQAMPLETFPDKFLNEDGSLFICSTHGARFRVEDGFCISGPCEGKSMKRVAIALSDGSISIAG